MSRDQTPAGVQVLGAMTPEYAEILTADALTSSPSCIAASTHAGSSCCSAAQQRQSGARRRQAAGFPARDPGRSATPTGRSRRCRPICRTAAWRSPARPTARW